MKYVILGLVFVVTPYILLSHFVMPALESLEQIYANTDKLAEQAVGPTSQIPEANRIE